jgi:diguanylate cyclase (GGDEF)-like protein
MRLRSHSRDERVGIPRSRLIGSILLAALLPFLAAWWIADAYVRDEARVNQDVRLTFAARSAAREASAIFSDTRTRAIVLARNPAIQRAARRHDRPALARLLGRGEAVQLAGGDAAGLWVGQPTPGAPAVRVAVNAGGSRLATVSVSAPVGQRLLDRVGASAVAVKGSELALLRGRVVVAGPAAVRGTILGLDGQLHAVKKAYSTQTVALPGYDPPARLAAVTDTTFVGDDFGALQRRLALVALVSLLAICLLAAALTRPLLRSLNRVAVVAEQAMVDPLTGTANRRGFDRVLAIELERSARRGHPCALVIVDLDDFKQVNDHHGHGVGDEVLVTLADRLRESVRSADTVARLGGEEFALLLPETDLAGAIAVAERARTAFALNGVRLKGGANLVVTASFGAADFPASRDEATLLSDADKALYTAKRLGKDRVVPVTRAVEAA